MGSPKAFLIDGEHMSMGTSKYVKTKSLELGINRQLTTGFRPSYLDPELGLISKELEPEFNYFQEPN